MDVGARWGFWRFAVTCLCTRLLNPPEIGGREEEEDTRLPPPGFSAPSEAMGQGTTGTQARSGHVGREGPIAEQLRLSPAGSSTVPGPQFRTMSASQLFLLCYELSLLWTKSDQVQQVLPPPRLFLEPRFPVRLGTPATYECVGAYGSNAYMLMLHKPGQQPQTVKWVRSEWEGRVGKFPMGNVTAEQAGLYSCMYQFDELYSKYSNEVPLVIRAVTMSPFLWVTPTTTPSFRQSLTFHCNSTSASDQYCLYHGSMEEWKPCIEALNKSKHEALFYYREVHRYVLGQYVCMTYNSSRPYQWSEISNTLLITLGGAPPFPFALWPHHIHVALTSAALGELLA
ncbi:natural cytotoxicity triggering receptor 1-like isoform X2 [Notamacropus eugenii]|uniref:natural cytotoxicity triggering receptor 1-like isoform X2 n=1 Tax=Notamacropus eugenii TaxID=9315 RepID=UPI003B6799BE